MKVIATICFPDDNEQHMQCLRELLTFYIKVGGSAGDTIVDLVQEDDTLVIDVGKGFHCLTIPIEDIKKILCPLDNK